MALLGISYIYMDYLIVIKLLENHSLLTCVKERNEIFQASLVLLCHS